jgi:hypothetical protein
MNHAPKTRNRLGLTPFDWRQPDIDAYNGFPFRPYPNYERVEPRDLVQMLENNFQLLWRECAPFFIPEEYLYLKATAHDELWENHPQNGLGGSKREAGFGETSVPVKTKQSKNLKDKYHSLWTEDEVLGIDSEEKEIIKKFYPNVRFP